MSSLLFSNFASFGVCLALLATLAIVRGYSAYLVFFLLLHCFLPFLTNHVLFDPSYMPDQFQYLMQVRNLRQLDFTIVVGTPVYVAAWLFFLIPMPSYHTVVDTSFASTFVYLLLFDYLYAKRYLSRMSLVFMLGYPSLALYSATGLRDTFIVAFMLLAMIAIFRSRWIRALLFLAALFTIKFENTFILVASLPSLLVLKLSRLPRLLRIILLLVGFVAGLLAFGDLVLTDINVYRQALYAEDGGQGIIGGFAGPLDLLRVGLVSGIYFFIKPLPWDASGSLQFVQAVENLLVTGFMVYLFFRSKASFEKKTFLLLALAMFCFVFGVIVFNFGTASRYRFPAILTTIVLLESPLEMKVFGRRPQPAAEAPAPVAVEA
ncbi:MAG TPA: hypothetical protein VNU97_13715 [Rhizomicrobium sp.]|jgi:hypothetical protein|nr:hypothetical protein [Rhizomicrobium sp.]